MSDGTIKIPTWALPIGAAALSGAMVWGASRHKHRLHKKK